jgi:hypothetical protein
MSQSFRLPQADNPINEIEAVKIELVLLGISDAPVNLDNSPRTA